MFVSISLTQSEDSLYKVYLKNPNYARLLEMREIYEIKSASIVMLGNSITYGINWNEALNRIDIANCGIPGDNTIGMFNRLNYVYRLKPKAVFIMAGINDIYANFSIDTIKKYYEAIVDSLLSKNIIVVIQSTLYVSTRWKFYKEKNKIVDELNNFLQGLCERKKLIFVNLNSQLSKNGVLMEDMTYDGVHLTAKAYKIWLEEIKKTIVNLKI